MITSAKSTLLSMALVLGSLVAGTSAAQAQSDFPNKPIRFIVPSSVGGGGDMVGRLLAEGLSKRLKQPLVVENNAGASGTIAIGQLAHAKPDGYTIGMGTMSSTTLAMAIYPKLPFDLNKDLMPIAGFGTSPIAMVATNDFPANNLKEFLAYAKAQPNPVQYASWGIGSTGNFCGEVLAQKTKGPLAHVPYKGTAPILVALQSGEISLAWVDMATATSAVRTGKIKPIALCTRQTPTFPNVQTYKEQGVDFDQWTGWSMHAPAGVPKPVMDKLSEALKETVEDAAVSAKLLEWGITVEFIPGPKMLEMNKRDVLVWKQIARDAGMKSD